MSRVVNSSSDNLQGSCALLGIFQTQSSAVLQMRELVELAGLPIPADRRLTKTTSDQLTRVLDRFNVALEPDVRYDDWPSTLDDEVIVFKAKCGGPINPNRPAYHTAKVTIDAIALSAAVDRSEPSERFEFVKNKIAAATKLSNVERARLLAYAFASLTNVPKLRSKMRAARRINAPNRNASLGAQMFPIAGAILLFGSGVFLNDLAVRMDQSPRAPQLSAADLRRECSLITEQMFHAECLQRERLAEAHLRTR
jgi:hypothetical protein